MEHDRLVQAAMNNLRLSSNARHVREPVNTYRTDNDPVIELVSNILNEAVSRRASDIHLEPVADGLRCRFRIDGQLKNFHDPLPDALKDFIISRVKIMCGMDIAEHRLPQDGRFIHFTPAREVDVRVSVIPLINGEKAVLRLLNDSRRFMEIGDIGFSSDAEAMFKKLIHSTNGAVIMAGPVNSGKTTSLYAAIQELTSGKENIMTIEDPVEYQIEGVNQLQVNTKTGMTFAAGLRASLRQDSDLIMLGEIRDEETAAMAIRAAFTGHLIFTTLHTASSAEGIFRLLDMGIKGYMISAAVRGVVAQRLVRRLCSKCRKKIIVRKNSDYGLLLGTHYREGMSVYKAVGCKCCEYTGYHGRVAIHEIMVIDKGLGDVIKKENVDLQSIMDMAKKNGMKDLWQDGIEKVEQGQTSLEELHRVLGIEGGEYFGVE